MIERRAKKVVGKMPDVTLVSSSSFCLCHTIPSQWWEQGTGHKSGRTLRSHEDPTHLASQAGCRECFQVGW